MVDLAVRVALFTDLCHLKDNIVALESCAYRKRLEIETADENVFTECSRYYAGSLFVELINFFL